MSYAYDTEEEYSGSRVLWTRIAFAVVAAALLFWLGRCTAPGVPESELVAANQRIQAVSSENQDLRQQVAAAAAGGTAVTPSDDPSSAVTADPGETETGGVDDSTETASPDGSATAGQVYVVEAGDTLSLIAEDMYGDAARFDIIAEENNLDPDDELRVGQELRLPADPDEG